VRALFSSLRKNPPPRLRRYFPQRGKIKRRQIFSLWGKWREGLMGAFLSVFRFPPEGGDQEPFSVREVLG